ARGPDVRRAVRRSAATRAVRYRPRGRSRSARVRRADHGPGRRGASRPVGNLARAGPLGAGRCPHHALPRGGRRARRPDRGDRPRRGDRPGHSRRDQGPRARATDPGAERREHDDGEPVARRRPGIPRGRVARRAGRIRRARAARAARHRPPGHRRDRDRTQPRGSLPRPDPHGGSTMSTTTATPTTTPTLNPRPSQVTLYLTEAKHEFLKLVRIPIFAVSTIALPVMFYVLFGVAFGGGGSGDDGPV